MLLYVIKDRFFNYINIQLKRIFVIRGTTEFREILWSKIRRKLRVIQAH